MGIPIDTEEFCFYSPKRNEFIIAQSYKILSYGIGFILTYQTGEWSIEHFEGPFELGWVLRDNGFEYIGAL